MSSDRVSTSTIFTALAGYWFKKYRVPLISVAVLLVVGSAAYLFLLPGENADSEESVLEKYMAGRKKTSTRAARYEAPEEAEGRDLANWMKKKLPEKVKAELASFEVMDDEKCPEGMDPDMWEMERMAVLRHGNTALYRKNYDEAIILYRQALTEKGNNPHVKAYAWGGIMEANMQAGKKAEFEQALGRYSETLQELGYTRPGENGFSPLMMYKRMQAFGGQIDDYKQKIDNVASTKEVPVSRFKQKLDELNDTFVGLCESVEKRPAE